MNGFATQIQEIRKAYQTQQVKIAWKQSLYNIIEYDKKPEMLITCKNFRPYSINIPSILGNQRGKSTL